MLQQNEFLTDDEIRISNDFINNGYIIGECESMDELDKIQLFIAKTISDYLKLDITGDVKDFLDGVHSEMDETNINDARLHVIQQMNSQPWIRASYFAIARKAISIIVGNELAMQRRINLSVQMPNDASSVLPVHADTWSGDSPYEVVLWVPYVDVFNTKSMFILSPEDNAKHEKRFSDGSLGAAHELMEAIKPDAKWLDIPYGNFLLFTQNLMHGNVLNTENTTRWSSNCRFKSVFSPYSDKRIGEFFDPITPRAATVLGSSYKYPVVKEKQ